MKTALITGAGGFIGSHLAELCVREGWKVRAFVHYNSGNRWGWLEDSPVRDELEVIAGDVRDFDLVYKAADGVDTIFHLAALIGIPYSYLSPAAYIRTNVVGTYNIVEAARMHGIGNVLVTSTSETYGTAQRVPIDEDHPLVGQSPYSASKIGADQIAMSFHHSFDLPVKGVRPFNTYGPRQSARAFIPTVISQVLAGRRTIKLGNLAPTRDLTFVTDTARGFLALAASDEAVGRFTNIGMKQEIAMGDLARLIAELAGAEVAIETDRERVRPGKSEVERLLCDNTRLVSSTDWRPAYTLEKGLAETIAWMRDHLGRYKVDLYNV